MEEATDRQRETLEVIFRHIRDKGFAPTLREIGAEMGITSTNGVNDHLRALERKGFIERNPMMSRAIRLTPKGGQEIGQQIDTTPGALVLRGSAEISDNDSGEHKLVLAVTDQAYAMLGKLVDVGLFGNTRADVAERLLYERLRDVLAQYGRQM